MHRVKTPIQGGMQPLMLRMITMFADASFCPNTNAAGWGVWVKVSGWEEGQLIGGGFKTSMNSPSEAELCAIVNGTASLFHNGILSHGYTIMLQSDNLRALGLIASSSSKCQISNHPAGSPVKLINPGTATETETKALATLTGMLGATPTVLLRHVRGHQSGKGRSWVNRQCDLEAKKHMREARDAKKNWSK